MNAFYQGIGLAAVLLLTGCSSDDDASLSGDGTVTFENTSSYAFSGVYITHTNSAWWGDDRNTGSNSITVSLSPGNYDYLTYLRYETVDTPNGLPLVMLAYDVERAEVSASKSWRIVYRDTLTSDSATESDAEDPSTEPPEVVPDSVTIEIYDTTDTLRTSRIRTLNPASSDDDIVLTPETAQAGASSNG